MFDMEDLEPYYGNTMLIDDSTFKLEKHEDLSGLLAIWRNESYLIYATPCYDNVAVPVHVIDCNNQEIGTDGYYPEIDTYERYCHIVKVLSEKILRRARM
jgi:hypothetical protein